MDGPSPTYAPHFLIALGVSIGALPAVLLRGAGALAFVVLVVQLVAGVVGLGVAALGVQCYRTENDRLATVAGLTVVGWLLLAGAARTHNERSLSLVPIWAWWLAVPLVVALARRATARIVNGG